MGGDRVLPVRVASSGERNLVLVHGWACHSAYWEPLAQALDGAYACHLVELPGHGETPDWGPYRTDDMVARLADALPPQTAGLVGYSMGGLLALTLAIRRPDLEFALALVSSMPSLKAGGNSAAAAGFGLVASTAGAACAEAASAAGSLLRGSRPGPSPLVRKLRLHTSRSMCSLSGAWHGLQWMSGHDVTDGLGQINRRTLVVHGTDDWVVPAEAGMLLARKIPGARLELLEGGSHTVFLDEPERFARLVREFFDGS